MIACFCVELVLAWALIGKSKPTLAGLQVGKASGVWAASCFLWIRREIGMLCEKQVRYFCCSGLLSELGFCVFPWN